MSQPAKVYWARLRTLPSTNFRTFTTQVTGCMVCLVTLALVGFKVIDKDSMLAFTPVLTAILAYLGNGAWADRKQFQDKRDSYKPALTTNSEGVT